MKGEIEGSSVDVGLEFLVCILLLLHDLVSAEEKKVRVLKG